MKKIFKKLGLVALFTLLTQTVLMANITPGEAAESLQGEIIGVGQTVGIGLVVFLMILYIAAPLGGFLFAKNQSKKKAEQNQEESGGLMSFVWGMGGALAGFFAMFFIVGYIGSMTGENQQNSTIDLVQGNQDVMKPVLGAIIKSAGGQLSGTAGAVAPVNP